ncbi:MAG: geranylgeranyl reductase family protein [Archaeoglobaceae archaeon]|nr:geranylgeranyl reductase family protein [Archaeoglobaceae archaeon]MDW8128139.1 geranylgeranyl reductase family protein [Archaeoglobaceae archaeon]
MIVDVVVAGIGIAGAFALRKLSKELEVVGIDKREKLGFPVKCGEIIPTRKEMESLIPNLYDPSLFDIPKRFESNRTKRVYFHTGKKEYWIDFEFHVVRRDEMIQRIALESGHRLELGTVIRGFKDGKLITDKGDYEPKVLISSDGANSRIAKDLGLWSYEISSAKQYLMKNVECDEKTVYMFLGKEIAPGAYAWIIPKGNGYANVGVGFRKEFSNESVHRVLERFVKECPYSSQYLKRAEIVSKVGAVVPIDRPFGKAVHGNVIFAGDSASMIISHTGGGIPISMIAGDLAGEVVNKFFEGGSLEEYDLLWKKYLLRPLTTSYRIKKAWDLLAKSERISGLINIASKKDLEKIFHCQIPLKLKLLYPLLRL